MTPRHVVIGDITIGNDLPLVFIVGPNTLESRAPALEMSAALAEIARGLGTDLIYKPWFDKPTRASTGKERSLWWERCARFGYNTLGGDVRALRIMAKTGDPVVFDASHAVAQPGALGDRSGGEREFAPILARAAVAVGIPALFIE